MLAHRLPLQGRWCKGETSGHFIKVVRVFADCDRDSLVYLSEPIGPACHTVLALPTTNLVNFVINARRLPA